MPLTVTGPPSATTAAVAQQLTQLITSPAHGGRALAGAADVALVTPHAVYTATLDDALAGGVVARATHTDWRYLVQAGERTVALADATTDPAAPAVTQLGEGPFGPATARAINTPEALPQVRTGHYELRTLRVPALNVVAVWLHGADDLLIPLEPAGAGLQAGTVYDAARFEEALRAAAAVRAAAPEGSTG